MSGRQEARHGVPTYGKYVMTSRARHDVKSMSYSSKVRHDVKEVCQGVKKHVMASQPMESCHDVKGTSWRKKVCHNVKKYT